MDLTTGKLDNGYTVVCVLSQGQQNCNKDNLLFTLNQQNAQNPNAVFVKMSGGPLLDENGKVAHPLARE